ncbi:hypothetical protein ACFPRL_11900 [Pseudoclavibacter helvolus]
MPTEREVVEHLAHAVRHAVDSGEEALGHNRDAHRANVGAGCGGEVNSRRHLLDELSTASSCRNGPVTVFPYGVAHGRCDRSVLWRDPSGRRRLTAVAALAG